MADSPRIEELRRRVDRDPASILFAQLADELRRAGNFEEAVRVSRAGLARYPAYLSARVTLARALMDLGHFDDAGTELNRVLMSAPDNLAALRSISELHDRRRAPVESPRMTPFASAPRLDPDDARVVAELEEWLLAIELDRRVRRVSRAPLAGV